MASGRDQIVMAFNLELESRKAMESIHKMDKSLKKMVSQKLEFKAFDPKSLKKYEKELGSVEANLKSISSLMKVKEKGAIAYEFSEAEEAAKNLTKVVQEQYANIKVFRDRAKKEQDADKKARFENDLLIHQKNAEKEIKQAKKNYKKKSKILSAKMNQTGLGKRVEKRAVAKGRISEALKGVTEKAKSYSMGADLFDGFKEGLDSLRGKDPLGVAKAGLKMSASLFKKAGAVALPRVPKFGDYMKQKGDLWQSVAGKVPRGIKGKGMNVAGKAMSFVGGNMTKVIGPLIGTLAKMGPLIAASAAIFAGIVKLVVDVEAAVKGMNKEIMEGASLAEHLASSGGNSVEAFKGLKDTLAQVRDNATDVTENMKWGTKAEDVIKITNALTQQGMTLRSMEQSFKTAGESSEVAGRQIRNFGELARMSFGYAKLMGVSINEVTDLQAELFADMGTSLSGIKLEFARLTKEANESGIATNKFFSIIRNVSSDLSLYTTRLGQAAKMLNLLSKVMSPRNAAKFMATMAQGMKGMSTEERLKQVKLAGAGKSKEIVLRDLADKQAGLIADMQKHLASKDDRQAVADLTSKAMKGDEEAYKKLKTVLEKLPKDQQGAIREGLFNIRKDTRSVEKGGEIGIAEAYANLSMGANLDATLESAKVFGGGKKLRDLIGMNSFAVQKVTGRSQEELNQFAMLQESVDDQREKMKALALLKKEEVEAKISRGELTKEDMDTWSLMQEKKLTDVAKISALSSQEIINTLSKGDSELIKTAETQEDYIKRTSDLTVSILDKVSMIVDGIFNNLGKKLQWLMDGLHKFIGMFAGVNKINMSESKALDDAILSGGEDKNSKLAEVMYESGRSETDLGAKRGKWADVVGPALHKGMAESIDNNKQNLFAGALSAEEKKSGKLEGEKLEAFKKEFEKSYQGMAFGDQLGKRMVDSFDLIFREGFRMEREPVDGLGEVWEFDKERLGAAVDMDQTISAKKREDFKALLGQGKDPFEAMREAKFDTEDAKKFMAKAAVWGVTPEEFSKIIPNMKVLKGQAPADLSEDTEVARKKRQEEAEKKAKESAKATTAQPAATPTVTSAPIPAPTATSGTSATTVLSAAPVLTPVSNAATSAPTPSVPLEKLMGDLISSIPKGPGFTRNDIGNDTVLDQVKRTLQAPEPGKAGAAPDSFFPVGPEITPKPAGESVVEAQEVGTEETVNSLQDLWVALRRQGVRIDRTQLDNQIKATMEKSVLDAVRVALFEFAVYTADDPNQVLEKMEKSGLEAGAMAKKFREEEKYAPGFVNPVEKNAEGGLVTQISGGLARVNPAPGEGLASIGKGERIIPADGKVGGSTSITVNVQGIGGQDLANLIREKANQAVYEYKRREKFN